MTPTTTITTIALQDFKSTATTAAGAPSSTPAAHVRHPRTTEALAWLTQRLNWEDHLDRLHQRRADNRDADIERS